jgi:hypothetical protein
MGTLRSTNIFKPCIASEAAAVLVDKQKAFHGRRKRSTHDRRKEKPARLRKEHPKSLEIEPPRPGGFFILEKNIPWRKP